MCVQPYRLLPQAGPWPWCCLRQWGPGRYNTLHLSAAEMKWSTLHSQTQKHGYLPVSAGWEIEDSTGSESRKYCKYSGMAYTLQAKSLQSIKWSCNKIISCFLSCLSWYLIMYFQSKCETLPAILSFAQKWWSKYCSQCLSSLEQILLTNRLSYKLH